MTERSLFWDGTAGDGGPYNQTHMMDIFFNTILGSRGDQGVLYNWLDGLEVTGIASPVNVAAGGAVVYGMFYESDAAVSVAVPTPASDKARYDRIVLRRDWVLQTVRIARITSTEEADPTAPTLTQTAGVTWEIPLALLYIDDAGVITVTDEREYVAYPTNWAAVDDIVTTTEIAEGAITADNIANRTRWDYKGAGSIEPDADNPCAWASGTFNYWSFAAGSTQQCWVYFMVPVGHVPGELEFFIYTAPVVAGAGDVEWNYTIYWGGSSSTGAALNDHSSIITPAQGGRAVLTPNQDPLVWLRQSNIEGGQIVALQLGRNVHGGIDTFANAMALYGIEMRYLADA
jgi:hypothetical protein